MFLPLVGAYTYIPLPLWGTELSMCFHNIDRTTPLHLFWSYPPFWDTLITLIVLACRYAEPTMIVYFIWTVAAVIKDERIDLGGDGPDDGRDGLRGDVPAAHVRALLADRQLADAGPTARLPLPLVVRVHDRLDPARLATIGKCREMFRWYFDPYSD